MPRTHLILLSRGSIRVANADHDVSGAEAEVWVISNVIHTHILLLPDQLQHRQKENMSAPGCCTDLQNMSATLQSTVLYGVNFQLSNSLQGAADVPSCHLILQHISQGTTVKGSRYSVSSAHPHLYFRLYITMITRHASTAFYPLLNILISQSSLLGPKGLVYF